MAASSSESMVMSDEKKAELKKIFDTFDEDKDGVITKSELRKAFDKMNIQMSDLDIAKMITEADTDGSDSIDFEEYVTHKQHLDEERLLALFKKYDKDGDGFLEVDEVIELAKEIGHQKKISKRTAKMFIKSVDKDGDKKMNFEEFKVLSSRGQNDK